jgi:magnesium transporter
VITCRLYRDGSLEESDFDPARVSDLLAEEGTRVWLDVTDPTNAELATIGEEFSLHPLVIEDLEHRGQRAKVEQYEHYVFIAIHALHLDAEDEIVDREVFAVASPSYLITLRYSPLFELDQVLARWDRHADVTSEGAGFLLYVLLDEVVDGYFEVIERYEDLTESIEDAVFSTDDPTKSDVQERLFRMKREVVAFRRFAMPVRTMLDRLIEQQRLVTPALIPYYRDVSDHVLRVLEFADNIREILTASLEAQLSQVSNRLNQIMKQVASWSAIILLPTLIAGIYGMNFQEMPELHWAVGYPFAIGLMAASALLLYRMFRKRDWL